MLKTKEELNELKKEYEDLKNKLKELNDDELKIVVGGDDPIDVEYFNTWEILPTIES